MAKFSEIIRLFGKAVKGESYDYVSGSLRRSIFMLSIPMILEMSLESVFAVVDIFFVGRLGSYAPATVGLTESVLTLVYSIAIGLSMAATAVVARRTGEKNHEEASRSGVQAILIALVVSVFICIPGFIYAEDILRLMGAAEDVVQAGKNYTRIMMGGCVVIVLLFMINGIFRGVGDASVAMKSMWIANACNIILCPLFIYGWGPVPAFGLTGAAMATTLGRGTGVCYQLYYLFKGTKLIQVKISYFKPAWDIIRSMLNIASTATLQFIIASASWVFLARIIASFGSVAIAGYITAIRLLMFFLLPAWGLSNAAATLVGQNLGANQPERAEQSVWLTAKYNAVFMAVITLLFFLAGDVLISFMTNDPAVEKFGAECLRIVSLGYIFYGVGMVVMQAFNGAGDSRTPTWLNLFGFWFFQIPLAYVLAKQTDLASMGVFLAILISQVLITSASVMLFRRGKWKQVKV